MACAVSSDFAAVTSRYGLTQAQSTQGIATLAAQGGVATLSERSERRPQIADFISGRGKLRRTHNTGLKDLYRSAPLVPKGFCRFRQSCPFSWNAWKDTPGSQPQPPGSSVYIRAGISGTVRCK